MAEEWQRIKDGLGAMLESPDIDSDSNSSINYGEQRSLFIEDQEEASEKEEELSITEKAKKDMKEKRFTGERLGVKKGQDTGKPKTVLQEQRHFLCHGGRGGGVKKKRKRASLPSLTAGERGMVSLKRVEKLRETMQKSYSPSIEKTAQLVAFVENTRIEDQRGVQLYKLFPRKTVCCEGHD